MRESPHASDELVPRRDTGMFLRLRSLSLLELIEDLCRLPPEDPGSTLRTLQNLLKQALNTVRR